MKRVKKVLIGLVLVLNSLAYSLDGIPEELSYFVTESNVGCLSSATYCESYSVSDEFSFRAGYSQGVKQGSFFKSFFMKIKYKFLSFMPFLSQNDNTCSIGVKFGKNVFETGVEAFTEVKLDVSFENGFVPNVGGGFIYNHSDDGFYEGSLSYR